MTTMQSLAVPPSDPVDVLLGDAAKLVQIVSDVTGLSQAEAAHRLLAENRQLGSSVWCELQERQIAPYEWSAALGEFYATTIAFVFESIVWNRSSLKRRMRRWIADFLAREFDRPVRVLVFGDGLGFDSAFLASAGHEVSYFEVSEKAIRFARLAFQEVACEVEMLTDAERIPSRRYDVVVCLDVLEHVPDPVGMVERLVAALAPAGRLVVHAPFWYLASSVATHLASNRRFSGDVRRLYAPHGLRPVDAALFWDPLALARTTEVGKVSLAARLRVAFGGLLLSVGRVWSLPHILIVKGMIARSLDEWPAMQRLANGAVS